MQRTGATWLLVIALAAVGSACESDDPAGSQTDRKRAALQTADGPLRLAPPSRWVRLNPDGPALVSPSLSPDGRWVAAAGAGGVGLFVTPNHGAGTPELVHRTYRGPRAWTAAPLALHFGHGDVRSWRPGRLGTSVGVRQWDQPWTDAYGRQIHQGARGTWHHHPKRGAVTLVRGDASSEMLVEGGAWGVRVSPDGRRVAWSTGTLAAPRLYVMDAVTRVTRDLGAGVHPAWFPGSARLVFSRPDGVRRVGGRGNITGAELWLHEVTSGETRALTATPRLGEMQPVVSADGRTLLCADWLSGGLYRVAVLGGGGR